MTPPPVITPPPVTPEPPPTSGLKAAECPSVFAEPVPASPAERSDAGTRGLAALRAELHDSYARWTKLSAEHGGRYAYTRDDSSVFGGFCRTTMQAEGGEVTSRTELRSDSTVRYGTALWTEVGAELDSHPGACHRPATMEELYVECSSVLCKDPRKNLIYLELDDAGLLRRCTYFPMGCADDCSVGVNLSGLRLGDDAKTCCGIEGAPRCCMQYGGADVEGCQPVCDGMPVASAPWTRALDPYGCPRWVEPATTALDDCCGCP
jgi:hypothetical protein